MPLPCPTSGESLGFWIGSKPQLSIAGCQRRPIGTACFFGFRYCALVKGIDVNAVSSESAFLNLHNRYRLAAQRSADEKLRKAG